jgi:hypothetical protein
VGQRLEFNAARCLIHLKGNGERDLGLSAQKTPIARVSSRRAREIWQVAAARIALCGCGSGASSGNVAAPALVKCHPSFRFKRDSKHIEQLPSRTPPLRNFCQRRALGVKLTPADARRFALLGRHLLPAMIVLRHVLALGGWKLLELMIALENFLALLGRELPEVRVSLAQLAHFASRDQCEGAPA